MSDKFFRKFEMKVLPSRHKLRRMKPQHLRTEVWNTHLSDQLVWDMNEAAEEVECVDIVMPKDKLVELESWLEHYARAEDDWRKQSVRSGEIIAQYHKDQQVVIENPTVAAAYHKYRMLLELART
jgi:hypothetical protein